jgi:hypothetical protein
MNKFWSIYLQFGEILSPFHFRPCQITIGQNVQGPNTWINQQYEKSLPRPCIVVGFIIAHVLSSWYGGLDLDQMFNAY